MPKHECTIYIEKQMRGHLYRNAMLRWKNIFWRHISTEDNKMLLLQRRHKYKCSFFLTTSNVRSTKTVHQIKHHCTDFSDYNTKKENHLYFSNLPIFIKILTNLTAILWNIARNDAWRTSCRKQCYQHKMMSYFVYAAVR